MYDITGTTTKVFKTRFPSLGFVHFGPGHWQVVDRTEYPNIAQVGEIYHTKAELLADLTRYAKDSWGYGTPKEELILIHNHTPVDKQPALRELGHLFGDRVYLERAAHPVFGKDGVEIVLAYLPDNEVTPYVTWNHKDGVDDSGDYFNRLPEALEGFLKRIGKK